MAKHELLKAVREAHAPFGAEELREMADRACLTHSERTWELAGNGGLIMVPAMLPHELSRTALDLPPEDRLELARKLVESVVTPASLTNAVNEGVKRLEDVVAGRVQALTEEEYRAASR